MIDLFNKSKLIFSSFSEILRHGYIDSRVEGKRVIARVQVMVTGDILTSYAIRVMIKL